ncbi:sigma-70 family RNA polymerase sigma factor [Aromatoleum bremense]|uniref:Sigma-70 family RNA polymerase sigma factor n=1 Tax=Aromatoleum bremense TaxID=76115 RepID=A0ABX1NWQ9_9RHOO|nr:sigma-70 family RNA polymerase sigma factor [Aromatoleum bremense]NMG16102.1 sigma-70 family RNA polymerase sigma factor [Aromatoleum bremense]QTQ30206.1 RNA polymerase sigma-24-related protein [Aromatoleum bremense]
MSDSAHEAGAILWDDPSILAIRRDMLRFAQLQLRDAGAAEDMVQEALIAAISGAANFAGRAAFKTWMFAILRNKIVDHIRRASREVCGSDLVAAVDGDLEDFDALFDARGFWNLEDRPATWADPEASLSQQEFWAVFEACLNDLPEQIARVYMMREFLELETAEICRQLGITSNNCWVILHRARLGLRECLENRWFMKGAMS